MVILASEPDAMLNKRRRRGKGRARTYLQPYYDNGVFSNMFGQCVFRICPSRDSNPDWLRERQGSTLVLDGVDFESPPRPGILKF